MLFKLDECLFQSRAAACTRFRGHRIGVFYRTRLLPSRACGRRETRLTSLDKPKQLPSGLHAETAGQTPRISIVMPVFNGEKFLQRAIDSMLGQTLRHFELIIVNDGSTDRSQLVIAEAARSDRRIRYIEQRRQGVATALNNGLVLAQGEFIARMDADDIADIERLRKQLAYLVENPRIVALGSWARVIDERGTQIGELRPEWEASVLGTRLAKQNPFIHSSMMIRADLVRRLGGYRSVLEGAEDYDLWLRMSEYGQLANLPKFLMSYRRHSASISAIAVHNQLLMARLARISAADRRSSRSDLVENLVRPISLETLRNQESLRATADFYSLIGQSSGNVLQAQDFNCLGRVELNHAEIKAAQYWLKDQLTSAKSWSVRAFAFLWLLYLHPLRGISLVCSVFTFKRPRTE